MGKFKSMDIEQKELLEAAFGTWEEGEDVDFDQVMQEMYEKNVLQSAADLCRHPDYGYSKFLDELHKTLSEARGKEV